MQLNLDLN